MSPGRKRLNLIAWDNGVGLSRDLRLLADALAQGGFEVHLSPIRRGKLRKWSRPLLQRLRHAMQRMSGRRHGFDANLMLEHIRPEDLPFAARNLFIPNPEWCLPTDVALLGRIDGVLAKTRHAVDIFAARGCPTRHIGFTSEDRHDPDVPRERRFFHLAGRSQNKGTPRLIALWQRHPEWPTLIVLQSPRTAQPILPPAANIEHRIDYIDDMALRRLQNACRFHLCTSETEGFGHYLVEAMSVGAIAVTTDAPPMNELVDATRGVLLAHARTGEQHLARTYFFDERALEDAVARLLAMSDDDLQAMGDEARKWFLENDRGFAERLREGITPLLG